MPEDTRESSPQQAGDGVKRRPPLALIASLLVVAIVGIGLWLAFRKPAGLVQGMVDADSINVAAKISARVAKLYVREGDRVTAGQVLFELDSPEVAARRQQAASVLAAARATAQKAKNGPRSEDVRALEANWRRARAANNLAQVTFTRVDNLYREGVVTRQNRDEAQAQARGARAARDPSAWGLR